jgi:hypothetical protein
MQAKHRGVTERVSRWRGAGAPTEGVAFLPTAEGERREKSRVTERWLVDVRGAWKKTEC